MACEREAASWRNFPLALGQGEVIFGIAPTPQGKRCNDLERLVPEAMGCRADCEWNRPNIFKTRQRIRAIIFQNAMVSTTHACRKLLCGWDQARPSHAARGNNVLNSTPQAEPC